jgi:Skp family chaperone for outer membrane proteins
MDINDAVEPVKEKITPSMRYYLLHREEKNAKALERYHSKPDVIAKKEERERKKAEKEAEKEKKRQEREKKQQERIQIAMETKRSH